MRHNPKRSLRGGKPQQKKSSRTKVFDSNGPDVRIRGTAWQVTEKYDILAKDAETAGNYVLAENYRQHAEHYHRIINSFADEHPVSTDSNKNENVNHKSDMPVTIEENERELAIA